MLGDPGLAARDLGVLDLPGAREQGRDPVRVEPLGGRGEVADRTHRHAEAVRNGKVDLKLGSASDLPSYDQPFDKIFSINSIHFWTDPISCLGELRKRLKPGGLIAITLQPRSRGSSAQTTEAIGKELLANLEQAGFNNLRLVFKQANPAPIACAMGRR